MATYGSRDSGNFSYSNLQNVPYYTEIDSVTGEITLKSTTVADPNVEGAFVPSTSSADDRTLGKIDPQTGVFTATEDSGTSDDETGFFSSPEGIKSVKESALIVANKSQQALGIDPSEAAAKSLELIFPNKARGTDETGDGSNPASSNTNLNINEVASSIFNMFGVKTSKQKEWGDLVFPSTLRAGRQDVIKFSQLQFRPRKFELQGNNISGFSSRSPMNGSLSKGSCTLPIPGGISDQNSANWGQQTMTSAQAAAGALAVKALESDFSGLKDAVTENTEAIKQAVKAEIVQAATGTDSAQFLARTEGLVMNPNMELLFGGPELRNFGFTFKFSPRNAAEARVLITIIRFFKQGLAPQRTSEGLFLKAPRTWMIQYLHEGTEHKFLNKFKECALQSFSVNYTPDGNYSTYKDGVMTSYELTMSYGELEPVFSDDYADDNSSIGF